MLSPLAMLVAAICGAIAGFKRSAVTSVLLNAVLIAALDAILNRKALKRSRLETRQKIWGDDSSISIGYRAVVGAGYLSIWAMALLIEAVAYGGAYWLSRAAK